MNDKLQHFIAGFVIAAAVALATGNLGLAAVAVMLAACGKEVYDSFHPKRHTADWWDIAATLAGWVPVALLVEASHRAGLHHETHHLASLI